MSGSGSFVESDKSLDEISTLSSLNVYNKDFQFVMGNVLFDCALLVTSSGNGGILCNYSRFYLFA